jgi:hypothetical protein
MIDRISKNEERLDKLLSNIKELEVALENFKTSKKDLDLLNKYYDSKNWLKDKDAYENGSIPKIKAGVLSEDAIWNMNEELKDLIKDMKNIVKLFYR